jgi:SPP1 family predicted phage head-tail adaptor
MFVNSGLLNKKAVILKKTDTEDEFGQRTETYEEEETRVYIRNTRSNVVILAQAERPVFSHEIFMRLNENLKPGDRIEVDGTVYHVKNVEHFRNFRITKAEVLSEVFYS